MKTIESALLAERGRLKLEPALPFKVYAALTICSWSSKDRKYFFPRASREYACALLARLAPNNSGTCAKESVGSGVDFLMSLGFVPLDDAGKGHVSMNPSEEDRLRELEKNILQNN